MARKLNLLNIADLISQILLPMEILSAPGIEWDILHFSNLLAGTPNFYVRFFTSGFFSYAAKL